MFVTIHRWANWVGSDFLKLLWFFVVPIMVEPVFPEWAQIAIYLIITFAIDILKAMWIGFAFGDFKLERIGFEICFVVLCYISVVFNLMGTVVFLIFGLINVIYKCGVFLLPPILALGNTRIHVSVSDSSNI